MLEDLVHPSVGALIRRCRERQKISGRTLSASAGLSPSYISKVEAGEIEPSLRAFSKIALVLRMTQQEIWLCVVQAAK